MVYYIVSGLFLMFFWCPCMAINVVSSVQYNGGLLPDIMLLTQCYFVARCIIVLPGPNSIALPPINPYQQQQ